MKESGLEGYEFFAYISYCDQDAAFAKKLQRYLEHYKLPVLLSRQYPRTPRKLTPVFREDTPQSGALAKTKFLIPICSEAAAHVDEWGGSRVDAEVRDFVAVAPEVNRSRVIPIIFRQKDGARATACIPAAVKALDLLALDVLDKGYEQVCNQLVSRMVGIKPGVLWNRWLRKARRNMALAASLAFPVLVAALVAMGGGLWLSLLSALLTVWVGWLCARWYTTPSIVLFERFIEENNLPVGQRKLTARAAAGRAYHYRFTYQRFRLSKVECCNSSGVPLPQQRPGFTHDEVACLEIFYNEKGLVNRQRWSDEHGLPLREVLFEQQDGQEWVSFRSSSGDEADSHQLSKDEHQTNSPVTRYRVQRNAHGHITEVHYYNENGARCVDCDGTWGRRYDIDTALGVVTKRTYLDEHGAATPNHEGVAGRSYEYDAAGRMIAFTNVNEQGEAVYDYAMVSSLRCELDEMGNRIGVRYLAPNGQRQLCQELIAEKRTVYDERGFVTGEIYLDDNGQPTLNRQGYARCEYTRNAAGTLTGVRYYDTAGAPCLGAGFIHHERRTVDAFGYCNSATYFDTRGLPCQNADWTHQVVSQYDDNGRLLSEHYFDENAQPTLCRGGYHMVTYGYDEHGNSARESYFGTDELPSYNKDGVAVIQREFDPHRNCTREEYYAPNGSLCMHAITHVAGRSMTYDGNNRKIEEKNFDVHRKPCGNQEGYKTWEYDKRGIATKTTIQSEQHFGHGNFIDFLTNQQGRISKSIRRRSLQKTPISTENWQYNEWGLIVCHTREINDIDNNHVEYFQTHYEYDQRHRNIVKKYTDHLGSSITDSHGIAEYRYEYDDRGNQRREKYYNAEGVAILSSDGYASIVMEYDENNQLISRSYYDTEGKLCLCSDGYASIQYARDVHGNPIQISYRGINGEPVEIKGYSSYCYQYDCFGKITKGEYFNAEQQAVIAQELGIAAFTCEYDSAGKKIRERFFDTNGSPCNCSELGVAVIEWHYDENGRVKTLLFKDIHDKPCTCCHRYAIKTIDFQSKNIIRKESFYNYDGELIFEICDAGLAKQSYKYNEHLYQGAGLSLQQTTYTPYLREDDYVISRFNHQGNIIEESYYDKNHQLILYILDSVSARKVHEYDEQQHLIRVAFYNTDGELCVNSIESYAQCIYHYNHRGQISEEIFYDEKEHMCQNRHWARTVYTYDELGHLVKKSFLDIDGNPCLNNKNYACIIYTYDVNGQLVSETFCDENENPVKEPDNDYTQKVYSYDANGNIIEEAFYNIEGQLYESWDYQYARKVCVYNSCGNLIDETYYNTEGKLSKYLKCGYSRKTIAYDDQHHLSKETFYDSTGHIEYYTLYTYNESGKLIEEAFFNKDNTPYYNNNVTRKVYSYDEAGNLTQEAYYDHTHRLCNHSKLGYCRRCLSYDEHNRLIRESYFDSFNLPVFITDTDGSISGAKGRCFTAVTYSYHEDAQGHVSRLAQYLLDTQETVDVTESPTSNEIPSPTLPSLPLYQQKSIFSYFAFISYSSKDVIFANKLQRYIESFKLPINLGQRYPRSPRHLKPIFRDRTDLEQGNLGDMLMRGLSASKYLLVICSENSAQPNRFGKRYVDMEVNSFIALNPQVNKSRVIPIIYREHENTPLEACIPPAIREHGLEGIDLMAEGTQRTLNRVAARMTEVDADALWQQRQKTRLQQILLTSVLCLLIFSGLALGGIYTMILALLSVGILLTAGALAVYQHWGTRIVHYARFMEEHNLPIGIRELSRQELSHRERHYRFYYRGYRLRKIECCNALGQLVTQERPGYTHDEVARIELFYDDKGDIIRQLWSDTRGIVMRDIRFDAAEHYDRMQFSFPRHQAPAPHRQIVEERISPVTSYNVKRNELGQITEIQYYNHLGQACMDTDGTWGRRYVIDEEKSLITARYCLDNEGNTIRNHQGIAGRLYTYDANSNLTGYTNVDEDGQPVYEQAGFAGLQRKVDTWGNCTEVTYLSHEGESMLNRALIAHIKRSYQQQGLLASESYYNTAQPPYPNQVGYARCDYQYDHEGRVIETRYYNEQGEACCSNVLYHREERRLDSQGNIISRAYYDAEDKPCYIQGGIHRILRDYDEAGRIRAEWYEDIKEQTCYHSRGYHRVTYEYDACDNLIRESYYDTEGAPCYNADSVAQIIRKYDEHNNCIRESYHATDGQPCIHAHTKISSMDISFNGSNYRISEAYFGTTGQPCLNHEHTTRKKWKYDDRGLTIKLSSPDGYNKYVYDAKGRIIEHIQTYSNYDSFDEDYAVNKSWQYDDLNHILSLTQESNVGSDSFSQYHELRFEYDERRNIIRKTYINHEGNVMSNPEGIAEWQFEYDSFGRKTSETYYDSEGCLTCCPEGYAHVKMIYDSHGFICDYQYFDIHKQPCSCQEGYSRIHLGYTPSGQLRDISYENELGKPFEEMGYSRTSIQYNHAGQIEQCQILNAQHDPVMSKELGIASCRRDYDAQGRMIREYYLDTEGKPCLHAQLEVSIIEWSYNANGQVGAVQFNNTDGNSCNCIHGYAQRITRYDEKGKIKEEIFNDVSKRRIIHTQELTYAPSPQSLYEEAGIGINSTAFITSAEYFAPHRTGYGCEISYYNQHNKISTKLILNSEGKVINDAWKHYAKISYVYDSNGNLIEEAFYDDSNCLCQSEDGYARKTCAYDTEGNQTEEAYYDENNELFMNPSRRYARMISTFNEHNKRSSDSFYNTEGNLCMNNQHFAQCIYSFDENGHCKETLYQDQHGQPCINRLGYCRVTNIHHENGKLFETAFWDIEGRLCLNLQKNYSKVICSYDERGNITKESFLNTLELPCINTLGYAHRTFSYDEQGREIKIEFLGTDGQLISMIDLLGKITGRKGRCAYITYSYETNADGEEIKTARYYNEQGRELEFLISNIKTH